MYSRAVQLYEALILDFRPSLDNAQQAAVDDRLQEVRRVLRQDSGRQQPGSNSGLNPEVVPHNLTAAAASPTYVGKASDIHFIHSIRQCVHGHERPTVGGSTPTEDYHRDFHTPEAFAILKHPMLIPSQAEAGHFLDVYLSTIHIAYPFICKSVLLEAFQHFMRGDHHDKSEFRPWLALFSKTNAPFSDSYRLG